MWSAESSPLYFQKGLTSMRLPLEYVALLAFFATDVGKERRSKARQILLRVIQLRRDYMMMNTSKYQPCHHSCSVLTFVIAASLYI